MPDSLFLELKPRNPGWYLIGLLLACFTLELRADKVDDYIASQLGEHQIPGLSLAVVRDGRIYKARGYGYANLELKVPATEQTVYEIGSLTKQFTATLVLMLIDERKLDLEQHLSYYFKNAPSTWKEITIRQLLNHTSGLKNYTGLPGFEVTRKMNADEFIQTLSRYPLDFVPGEKWSYSNSGYNLLGYLIEKQSGSDYWQLLNKRILVPLKMSVTGSRDVRAIIPQRASGYEWEGKVLMNRDPQLTDVFSAGAMVSSVLDLVKWCAALENEPFFKKPWRDLVYKPAQLRAGETYPYGFGWRVEAYKGHRNIGHSGSTAGFSSSLQRYPDDKLTVIVLCNVAEQGRATLLARKVADMYFGGN